MATWLILYWLKVYLDILRSCCRQNISLQHFGWPLIGVQMLMIFFSPCFSNIYPWIFCRVCCCFLLRQLFYDIISFYAAYEVLFMVNLFCFYILTCLFFSWSNSWFRLELEFFFLCFFSGACFIKHVNSALCPFSQWIELYASFCLCSFLFHVCILCFRRLVVSPCIEELRQIQSFWMCMQVHNNQNSRCKRQKY